ncbi:DUF748 domain-containing protein [Shewanella sp. Isolate11]|uniref:DUF748 domain-containing protein n=1 Tax=Shewanella sp. Isolate11 TaxID=2908530 RepID=UPI001EFD5669|nr:DUF748 domain-containing protein [Shewanella sp. Isolate11]MCG9697067.1 DUF748 domain-containing protein [Shewanella sp. Isolate11]
MSSVPSVFARLRQKYKQLPKYQRYSGILLSLYLVWTLILGLLVPYIIVQQAPKQLSNLLNRPVVLNDVSINPFTLAIQLDHFGIAEQDNSPFVGFKQVSLQYQFWHSIFNWGFSFSDINIVEPYAKVRRVISDQPLQFNFSDILATLAANASQEPEPVKDKPAVIPHFMLANFAIVDANLNLADEITRSEVTYPRINLNIKYFDSHNPLAIDKRNPTSAQASTAVANNTETTNDTNRYDIEFHGKHGGTVALKGQVQLLPFEVQGDIALSNIDLPQFWGFVAEDFNVVLTQGLVDFSTRYRVAIDDKNLLASTSNGQFAFKQISVEHLQQPVLQLDQFALSDIDFNLTEKQLVIGSLDSEKLRLNANVDKQGVDLVKLFAPKSMQAAQVSTETQADDVNQTAATTETASAPNTESNAAANTQSHAENDWSAVLGGINLNDYQLALSEQLVNGKNQWIISNIALSTGSVDAALSKPIEYQLSLNINQQGSFSSQGQVDAKAQQVQAHVELDKLDLAQFQPYLAPYLNIKLEKGLFSTQGELSANAQAEANYLGAMQVDDLLIKDELHKETLVKWQNFDINTLEFDKTANKLAIDQVTLTQPYGRILIAADRTTNFQELVKTPAPSTETKTTEAQINAEPPTNKQMQEAQAEQAAMALSINKVIIKDGATFFADNSLTPNFASGIEQLEGTISHLSSSSDKAAKVDIKGKIDRYAPVTVKGEVNPLLPEPYLDLAVSFKHVELTSVNPYSGTYAGYYIDKGLMSLDLTYQLENNQLVGDNHLVIDQLALGKQSESSLATSLPVTLAIALLQDRNGVIDLGVQVSGDLNEPDFSFGSIILTAFTNVITKAVTAPFSLIAGLLGSDDELDKVAFNPGSPILSDDSQSLLDKLAKGLIDRPKLSISARGAVSLVEDSQALKTSLLLQKLASTAKVDIPTDLTPSTYPTSGPLSDALKQLYDAELKQSANEIKAQITSQQEQPLGDEELQNRWHIAMYNMLLNQQAIADSALGALAQQRAVAVKSYLIEHAQISPDRVFVLDSQAELNTSGSQALLTLSAD